MASSKSPPRIAVVGCGQWGQNLVRNFAKLRALDAVANAIPSRADEAAEQFLAQGYEHAVKARGWESVLADNSISAVVLATPAPQHADMAVAALNAGKHRFWSHGYTPKRSESLLLLGNGLWRCSMTTTGFPEPLKCETETLLLAFESREPLADECCHFLDCIQSGQEPLTGISEGLTVVRVLCAVGEILRQGQNHTTSPTSSALLDPTLTARSMSGSAKFTVVDKTLKIPLIDLAAQKSKIQDCLRWRLAKILDHIEFIMGPEVGGLESRLCAHSGATYAVTCASGTDALTLALLALRVHRGDAVLVPAFTFVATVEPVVLLGAVPIFVDVDPESLTIEPTLINSA